MTVIRVPKPPADAMNKDRPVSTLLKAQLEHMQEAERKFRLEQKQEPGQKSITDIKTEGEAAEFIRRVTRLLHPEGAKAEARDAKPSVATMKPSPTRPAPATEAAKSGIIVDRIAAQAADQETPPRQVAAAKKESTSQKVKSSKKRR